MTIISSSESCPCTTTSTQNYDEPNNGGSVGIEEIEKTASKIVNDPRVFTLDGRCLGTEVPASFRGIYLQNGKKHIKLN